MSHQGLHRQGVSPQGGKAWISVPALEPRDGTLGDSEPVGDLLLRKAEFTSALDQRVQERVILLHLLDGQGLLRIASVDAEQVINIHIDLQI